VGKIGGYTTQTLKAYASNTQMWIETRAGAVDALVDRVQILPDLRDEMIVFFRTLFTRPEAYQASEEHFIARLVLDSVNLDARELYPEIL
jgi:hypothetical protein